MKSIFPSVIKHLIPLFIFFIVVSALFYEGIFTSKVLNQHDILQWRGGAQEVLDYREQTGEEALWTNSMFSGMPAFLVSTQYWGDLTKHVQKIISLGIPRPYSLVFLAMACFYLLLQAYKVDRWVSVISAVAYGATTFVIIGVLAGHTSRIAAIAFLPLVIAGVKLVFDKHYLWGFVITSLGLALEIRVDHLQITYYLAIAILMYGVAHLIHLYREKDLQALKIQAPVLLLAALLAIGANYGKLSTTLSYSKYTTRGKSDLKPESGGLEKDYAFEFSNGIAEPLVLFIPNFFGGASNQELGKNSNLAKALKQRGISRTQINQNIQSVPTYWGDQRLSAPYYVGAAIVFLAVLGFFYAEKKERNWLLIVLTLGIVLSWGESFKAFNYFLFDYLPGYNKFRSVTFTLVLSVFGLAALAALGLNRIVKNGKIPSIKPFAIALGITGGFAILAALLSGMGSYRGAVDSQLLAQQIPDWYLDALREDRQRLLKLDALRSAFIVFLTAGLLWFAHKQKLTFKVAILLILGINAIDLILVNKRYIKPSVFQEDIVDNYFKPSPADEAILSLNDEGARVLNLQGTFNESKTSYLHASIGGYHGAKLGRYQELIERGISPEISELISDLQSGNPNFSNYQVLNMLNTGFIKYGDNANAVIPNPSANGNAWFVSEVKTVQSAQEEIDQTLTIHTKTTAVIDASRFDFSPPAGKGTVTLTSKSPNKLVYSTSAEMDGLVVFSEIYYPEGWVATIDGENSDILRANYVLRAMEVPAGEHEIICTFQPESITTGNWIMAICSALIFLSFVGVCGKSVLDK